MFEETKRDDAGYVLGDMQRTYESFKKLLEEKDNLYNFKIGFNISYSSKNQYYNIEIYPVKQGFNSQQYFIDNFENTEKLDRFAEKSNIGLITY